MNLIHSIHYIILGLHVLYFFFICLILTHKKHGGAGGIVVKLWPINLLHDYDQSPHVGLTKDDVFICFVVVRYTHKSLFFVISL